MKKAEIILIILVIINIISNIFLLTKYFEHKPILDDLSKTYLIETANR